ncbi:MAG: acetolactate synthase small subunit [Halobacteriota archaeon]
MSGETESPGPHDRSQPTGRRNPDGTRVDMPQDDSQRTDERVVLSAFVINEPGVTAKVTGLFARRQINIERIVGEPIGDGTRSRITFVVEPPHPGVEQVRRQLQKLLPVLSVDEFDIDVADDLTAAIDEPSD